MPSSTRIFDQFLACPYSLDSLAGDRPHLAHNRCPLSKISLKRVSLVSGVLLTLIIVPVVHYHSPPILKPVYPDSGSANCTDVNHQETVAKRAHNATLGFGEIVYISMPDRSDRQDAMTLLSAYAGLKLKLIPGVFGTEISSKAIPDGVSPKTRPSELGCWRAHADAWRYLLESDMDTLLIFEDDLDWNPNLKKTLENLSLQMQNSKIRVDEPSDYERANAPYGLDWDVLYLGSCKESSNPDFRGVVQIWDDPDVPDVEIIKKTKLTYETLQNFGLSDEEIGQKRTLSPAYQTVCTTAYGITRRGAQRLLITMSYIGFHNAVDTDMSRIFREGGLRGYTLTPPAFSQFRVGGSRDTDNRDPGDPRLGDSITGRGNLHGYNKKLKGSVRWSMVEDLQFDNWAEYRRIKEARTANSVESW
ncbi:hypothetical protein V1520DRAFT_350723 [Lipomyces starkeyi]|uniref:Glycosyl transferase family 25 domain-containing protein n=1 Tax=Lipomyces starkeyi NRRL Y-11557 TaxID=675824 RepID=A0A1E3Q6N7_LIPST|nr:hypothetical protein LIPSTDRAFT_3677 [Lipomyces starkeyi NRRL Y-11557]